MTEDILGAPYTRETIDLGSDAEGPLCATLVHRPAENPSEAEGAGAVLYIHGFVDYFFQRELGDWWATQGYDFYALDLRKYGRSHREGQTLYWVEDLSDYDLEINKAWQVITRRDGHSRVVLTAHSTGGLIAPLWAERNQPKELAAVILNSPWLDHFDPPLVRCAITTAVTALAKIAPRTVVLCPQEDPAAESLHQDFGGEWGFDARWKTFDFPPIYAGWLAAIRRAQRQLHRGLNLRVPVLVLSSARSGRMKTRTQKHDFDAVLNVHHIRRWAPTLGVNVTSQVIEGAVHDVFLSPPEVRAHAYQRMGEWVKRYL
ncbi:MAG: alpha/beta hydrolase [Rothia sp. (in: high G+C Gram-positive bacteria)]|nr:alpha/beta hydrolase [Rothia sp. (in: high G+C Gram-positive bacteria)]